MTGWDKFDAYLHSTLKDCIIIPNRGPHDITETDKEVIVDTTCGMAILRGAHVYKNGIIGAPHSLRADDTVSVYADLEGKCLKGTTVYSGMKVLVGNGISQVSRSDIFNSNTSRRGIGILMTEPIFQAPSLSDLNLDWVVPQNLPSIVCVHVLDPKQGETILDMCAAPGGKTSHIAALMENTGRIVALDKSQKRALLMERFKTPNMEIYTFDATHAVLADAVLTGGPPYPPASFDRILVDAPCSALGQRPSFINNITLKQLQSFPVIQHQLLLTAVKLLKPGGVIVYSTCTVTKEENEDQVSRLLAKCPEIRLLSTPWRGAGADYDCDLTNEQRSQVLRFDPYNITADPTHIVSCDYDTIGFFIAKFQKDFVL
ncbi:unnamed protein product [Lymnaea stagnalis]|uniref:SAM-dependent MTase RsmB/NOP-type domain-containing protein n=1 Tax=Lymnaea stagnalis TaxID=6523 RepID=A0AAV2H7T9_LYMST